VTASFKLRTTTLLAGALLALLGAGPAFARMTIWDLPLGGKVADMPAWIEFKGYACGSNGGPPLRPIGGWSDFAKCAPEADGLHEVYFEYDDEDEYIGRAHKDPDFGKDAGTVDKSFPIIASALFDDAGTLQAIRLVTDPRPDQRTDMEFANMRPRSEHYLMASYLASQFNMDVSRDCTKVPPEPKESAVGGRLIKLDCERVDAAAHRRYLLQERLLRKPGQLARDPHTGALTEGQFESLTRAEVRVID
jgi:hypothetical protein